jgi:hypothetical protein
VLALYLNDHFPPLGVQPMERGHKEEPGEFGIGVGHPQGIAELASSSDLLRKQTMDWRPAD